MTTPLVMNMDTGGRNKFQGKHKRIRNRSASDSSSGAAAVGPMVQSNLDPVKPSKKKVSRRPRSKKDNLKNSEGGDVIQVPKSGAASNNAVQDSSLLSDRMFAHVSHMHPNSKKALCEVLKLTHMTEIQSKTFDAAVKGRDVLGRARTGTGKTLAFLTPALERILVSGGKRGHVGVLVISPTRELASQIGDQAQKLITFHKQLSCQVMYGGTKMNRDVNMLNRNVPSFLIATPGRLLDHMENTRLKDGRRFGLDVMKETQILVLDETDRLLDMGFRREINKILAFLPKPHENRQTLLFSATVPKELKQIMSENMSKDYIEVDCIGSQGDSDGEFGNEGGTHTNILVKQTYTVLPSLDHQMTAVVQLITEQMKADPDSHKIVVFFPTARMVGFFADFFNLGLGMKEVIELHSKKSQSYRTKASDKFRNAKRGILFTSDVSARGVDYPNVTGVIQVGLPESRDQYVHRLGRTGRAGKEGQGILVLAPFEEKFLKELKKSSIDISENIEASNLINGPVDPSISKAVDATMARIGNGSDAKLIQSAEQNYQAFLGYYRGHMKRTSINTKDALVATANSLARVMGLKEQPALTKQAVSKMGLKGIKNIRVMSNEEFKAMKMKNNRGGGR